MTVDTGSNVTFTGVEGLGNGERQWMSLKYTVSNATGTFSPSFSRRLSSYNLL